ncbi:F-box domain-containing protein [Mycena indigotica]|uniref:F-box domain-containing protein n=1 Tax=Mycena indigotica TaxID=2126181 RepID=A0A8H6SH01_9AGAR|nr:F-box domain-containing protein [Mycena indigotica]KAF7298635.1 F-box domain-containing protein [Mycena indigotica]
MASDGNEDLYAPNPSLLRQLLPPPDAPSSQHRTALARIDKELVAFTHYTDNYRLQLDTARTAILESLSRTSFPFNTLPVEIITYIFIECLPKNGYVRPSTRSAPLLFTRVCRGWRHIALTTTELWLGLEWELMKTGSGKREAQRAAQQEDGLKEWIARAKWHPMSLRLPIPRQTSSGRPVMPKAIEKLFPRLVHLRVDIPSAMFNTFVRKPTNGELATVNTITANLNRKALRDVLAGCPQLRELHLLPDSAEISIAAPALHKLRIDSEISVVQLLKTLRDCPQLFHMHCYLQDDGEELGEPDVDLLQPLSLPQLHSLSITMDCHVVAEEFLFRNLETLPNLTSVRIEQAEKLGRVYDLLDRSACTGLRYLYCDLTMDDDWHRGRDPPIMGRWPSLEVFEADLTLEMMPDFFARLAAAPGTMLPRLRKLKIYIRVPLSSLYTTTSTLNLGPMLDFLAARCTPGGLEALWIFLSDVDPAGLSSWHPHEVFVKRILPLIENGLDFAFLVSDYLQNVDVWPAERSYLKDDFDKDSTWMID